MFQVFNMLVLVTHLTLLETPEFTSNEVYRQYTWKTYIILTLFISLYNFELPVSSCITRDKLIRMAEAMRQGG